MVVLVIERAITAKEKEIMLEKMNMVIGAFFSDAGTQLLEMISAFNPDKDKIRNKLLIDFNWDKNDFNSLKEEIKDLDAELIFKKDQPESIQFLEDLKFFLSKKREFMLRLLENPNLLEHDDFTDLLWAVFHLTEELLKRYQLDNLSAADYEHLSLDIKRAYSRLVKEWLQYMEHLLENYPYLFFLAIRTNHFDKDASVEIKS